MGNDSILLQYKCKKGETVRYRTTVDSHQDVKEKGQSMEISSKVEMVMAQTCTDIAADGTMSIDVLIEEGYILRNGERQELPNKGQKIAMKMKKSGDITSTSTPVDFSQPSFPEEPKAKKDRWNSESLINIPNRNEPVKLDYKYILWDTVKADGYDCAEIKVSCPETAIELQEGVTQTISATGATYFAYKEGLLVKSEVETKTDIESPKDDAAINTRIRVKVVMEGKPQVGAAESAPAASLSGDFNIAG